MKRTIEQGLIVCANASDSARFTQLANRCGWPVLIRPELRTLARELVAWSPARLVFWLERAGDVSRTQRLIAWARERHPHAARIILAYEIDLRFERYLRAAGAQYYLPLFNDTRDAFEEAVRFLCHGDARPMTAVAHGPPITVQAASSRLESSSELIRPP